MNRISVLVAAGALGTAALTAGCSGSTSTKGAGTASSVGSATSSPGSESAAGAGTGSAPTTAGSTAAQSSAGGTTSAPTSSTAPASSSAASHAGGSACTTAEMPSGTWRVVPASEGAGHVAADLALQNTSGHMCTVSGYPGVSLLASNDRRLPTNVVKDTAVAVTTVKVAPGAWVHSEMRYSPNVPGPGEPDTGQCEPMTVHALGQLPGDSAWAHITLDNPTPVCEKGELDVKPFVSGQSSPAGG